MRPGLVPSWWSWLAAACMLIILGAFLLLPAGENPDAFGGHFDEEAGVFVPEETRSSGASAGRIIGQLSLMALGLSLLLAIPRLSSWSMSNRSRRRTHAWLGAAIVALSLGHGVMLLVADVWRGWHVGVFAILLLCTHGLAGSTRAWAVARWGQPRWRWTHLALGWSALAASLWHTLVYGQHYGLLRGFLLE